ncbi:hypothetical protein SYNPS1DRAFT_23264 [Syncephalis pseudoplumigaleata]|uniref:Uncharacterized protein n=1 Tax=Syncephalis pseudoplumigaleata TaxID=1712513 RepID=A0A4P9YYM3_9FUNG|nr:hypothetical protein SYNPS1DRAFT_23264 [Syncephalis pseudoplumigaleata]|eukprot:RKP24672.1 hypothetical protein SYNPS1DRAFT_23264 [Syncephalis pseudoplumigaleata]
MEAELAFSDNAVSNDELPVLASASSDKQPEQAATGEPEPTPMPNARTPPQPAIADECEAGDRELTTECEDPLPPTCTKQPSEADDHPARDVLASPAMSAPDAPLPDEKPVESAPCLSALDGASTCLHAPLPPSPPDSPLVSTDHVDDKPGDAAPVLISVQAPTATAPIPLTASTAEAAVHRLAVPGSTATSGLLLNPAGPSSPGISIFSHTSDEGGRSISEDRFSLPGRAHSSIGV